MSDADDPVELAGLAERPGEEHPGHVHGDGAEEDVGGPVVGLAHQQAGAHVEREADRRGVGLGHVLAPQRRVAAVVHDLVAGGHEVQGQEDAGAQQDDERVEGDLAEHERPVVGEDLVEERPAALGDAQAVVHPVEGLVDHGRSQNPGPTAWSKLPLARICPVGVHREGQLGQRAGGGAELRDGTGVDVEDRLVARAHQLLGLLLVEADRAAEVGAQLGVGHVALDAPRRSCPGGRSGTAGRSGRAGPGGSG